MRVSTFLIVAVVLGGVGFGVYKIGHATDQPVKQLETVISMPAQAASATAQANLSGAVSAAASYRIDHGSFASMSTSDLRGYDKALAAGVSVKQASAGSYCIESTVAGATESIRGPNGTFVAGRC